MEISWITPQIGVGGAIWREDRMIELVRSGGHPHPEHAVGIR